MPRRKGTEVASESQPTRRVKSPALMLGIFALGLIVAVGAVMLGRSDDGQIDVAAAVREAGNTNTQNGESAGEQVNVPSEAFRNMPNGGLVSQGGDSSTPAPVEGTATTTEASDEVNTEAATSSDETQTEDVSDEAPEVQ